MRWLLNTLQGGIHQQIKTRPGLSCGTVSGIVWVFFSVYRIWHANAPELSNQRPQAEAASVLLFANRIPDRPVPGRKVVLFRWVAVVGRYLSVMVN